MRAIPLLPLLLLIAGPALAAPVTVLHGTADAGTAPDAAAVQAAAAELLGEEEFEVAAPLAEALDLSDPLYAVGVDLSGCDERAVTGAEVAEGLSRARQAVDELDYTTARLMLAGAAGVLTCLTEPVEAGDLYDIWFLAGLMAFYEQDAPAAEQAFMRAAGVDATRPWNPAYAPDAQGIFLEALQKALAETGPSIQLGPDLVGRLTLNGSPLQSGARPVAGTHLLQLTDDDGVVTSFEIDLPHSGAGAAGWLLGPVGVERGLLAGQAELAGFFAERIEALGWERVLLVDGRGSAVRYDARVQRFSREAWPALPGPATPVGPDRPGLSGQSLAGVVTIGAGALVGGVGFGIHGSAWQRGQAMREDPVLGSVTEYQGLQQENRAGLVVGLAGVAVAATGLVVTLASMPRTQAEAKVVAGRATAAPWAVAAPGGLAFGLGGTW